MIRLWASRTACRPSGVQDCCSRQVLAYGPPGAPAALKHSWLGVQQAVAFAERIRTRAKSRIFSVFMLRSASREGSASPGEEQVRVDSGACCQYAGSCLPTQVGCACRDPQAYSSWDCPCETGDASNSSADILFSAWEVAARAFDAGCLDSRCRSLLYNTCSCTVNSLLCDQTCFCRSIQ